MPTELLTLIALHFACSDVATVRPLSLPEATACNRVYTEVKLAFVDGIEFEDYNALPQADKLAINKAGYRADYSWKQDHPYLVQHLEAVARGETRLAVES